MEYPTNGDIPKSMKLVMIFIDRVGFPVVAFLLMFYMAIISQQRMTASMDKVSETLMEIKASSMAFQNSVSLEHGRMIADIKENSSLIRTIR